MRTCRPRRGRVSRPIGRILWSGFLRTCSGSHPSRRVVADALMRPTRRLRRAALSSVARRHSASARTRRPRPARPSWSCSGWGLPSHLGRPRCWWSLTPPFHPYPHSGLHRSRWRSVSVALSREFPRVAVSHHLALRSPDLPQQMRRYVVPALPCRGCPVGSPACPL